jgi:hypothetical protein
MLHSAHRMSKEQSEWFKNTEESPTFEVPPDTFNSYLKPKKCKPADQEYSTSQVAFNINNSTFENLQIQQTTDNPYSPYLEEDFHSAGIQYFEVGHDTELPQPFFLPFGNLYSNIVDFVETTIVQYVCQRSHPSPFRLAAEILARSKLNPNANEFTPTKKNVSVIEAATEKVETHLCNSSKNIDSEGAAKKEETMTKVTDGDEEEPPSKDDICSKLVQCEVRSNSLCDIENYDGFESDDECVTDDSDNDGMSDDYEDDSDWDSEEQSTGQCVDIDPSEFEDLFPSPLLMANLRICQTKTSNPEVKISTQSLPTSSESNSELNPSHRSLSEINKEYFNQNKLLPGYKKSKNCCVNFCDDVDVIEEPMDIAEDLQKARISDFPARKADHERMERLLAPILTKVHREKMFQKIYGIVE